MLSKYAVPESEKGCGIMSTSTLPSRIRQKLLIPGAFCSRGITLCGYEFAGHRYDWDKRPGWRDYPSSSSQVRTKKIKSIIWVNREMKPALSLHSFFVALSFQAYAWAAGSLVVSQRPCQLCRLWLSQLHIHPLLWWIIFGKSSLWSRYVFLRSCPTSGSVRLHLQRGHIQWEKKRMDYIYSVKEEEGTLSHWDNKGKKTNLTCEFAVRRTIDCLLSCHSTLNKTTSLPPFCCMWAIIRDAAVWSDSGK